MTTVDDQLRADLLAHLATRHETLTAFHEDHLDALRSLHEMYHEKDASHPYDDLAVAPTIGYDLCRVRLVFQSRDPATVINRLNELLDACHGAGLLGFDFEDGDAWSFSTTFE